MKKILLAAILIGLCACADKIEKPDKSDGSSKVSCYVLDSVSAQKVSRHEIGCIKAATATHTGENQDAEDWVALCHKNALDIFGEPGTKWQKYVAYSWIDKSSCIPVKARVKP